MWIGGIVSLACCKCVDQALGKRSVKSRVSRWRADWQGSVGSSGSVEEGAVSGWIECELGDLGIGGTRNSEWVEDTDKSGSSGFLGTAWRGRGGRGWVGV